MNKTEYIAEVICYYNKKKTKLGCLKYDDKMNRFTVVEESGKNKGKIAPIFPPDGIHCGDIYVVQDNDGKWKIAQCEKTKDGLMKMLGTEITEKNCNNNLILYVKDNRLTRITEDLIDESFNLGELSTRFVYRNLLFN